MIYPVFLYFYVFLALLWCHPNSFLFYGLGEYFALLLLLAHFTNDYTNHPKNEVLLSFPTCRRESFFPSVSYIRSAVLWCLMGAQNDIIFSRRVWGRNGKQTKRHNTHVILSYLYILFERKTHVSCPLFLFYPNKCNISSILIFISIFSWLSQMFIMSFLRGKSISGWKG